jgi:hypothetical protein
LWGKKEAVIDYKARQSERITLALPIQVTGSSLFSDVFNCDGWTEVVSETGARIRLAQNLSSDQEITVRCVETGREAAARVVARVGGRSKQGVYGIMLPGPEAPPWGITFPHRGDSVGAVGRIVLECLSCHSRELVYLDAFELEVLETNEVLSRFCRRCTDSTIWRKAFEPSPSAEAVPEDSPWSGQERRRELRREIRTLACIRSYKHGEELVKVRNVSRSGICFEGRRAYHVEWVIDVAIPFSSGGGNIFLPARIACVQTISPDGLALFGAEYTRA